MGWAQGSAMWCPWVPSTDLGLLLQLLLLFQLSREVPHLPLWRCDGGRGMDRGVGTKGHGWREGNEGLGPEEGSVGGRERPPPRLEDGPASCPTGPGQPVGGRGHGAARERPWPLGGTQQPDKGPITERK